MKIAVFYTSLSGNTREAAEIVASAANARIFDVQNEWPPIDFDFMFFGTYTWGDGQLPMAMRKFLRRILIEERRALPPAAVFGTGDSIFPRFCRAVDETIYHLKKHGVLVVGPGMKIEQSPYGLGQAEKLSAWAREVLQEYETYRASIGRRLGHA